MLIGTNKNPGVPNDHYHPNFMVLKQFDKGIGGRYYVRLQQLQLNSDFFRFWDLQLHRM